MGRHVTVKVILPFDTAVLFGFKEPYKTLYFCQATVPMPKAFCPARFWQSAQLPKGFAVIIPDGENSFYTNQEDIRALYETFVSEELVAVTRKLFPLSDKREDTYIGGISMGGFGSLMLGSRHMDTFSKILALSPATNPYRNNLLEGGFTRVQLDRYFKSEEYYLANYHPANNLKRPGGRKGPAGYLPVLWRAGSTHLRDGLRIRQGDGAGWYTSDRTVGRGCSRPLILEYAVACGYRFHAEGVTACPAQPGPLCPGCQAWAVKQERDHEKTWLWADASASDGRGRP